jgi:hypothetical protein
MRRHVATAALIVAVVSAGYAASAYSAESAASRHQTITLRSQDIAVFGSVQCIANVEGRIKHFLCSRRPRARSKYDTAVYANDVIVFRMGNPDEPLFATR